MRPFKQNSAPWDSQKYERDSVLCICLIVLVFLFKHIGSCCRIFLYNHELAKLFFWGGGILKKAQSLMFSHANRARFTVSLTEPSLSHSVPADAIQTPHVLCCTKTSISFRRYTELSQSTELDLCSSLCGSGSADFSRNSSVCLLLEMLLASLRERKI